MKFIETTLKGSFVIELEKKDDDRGFFARSFCRNEFAKHKIHYEIVQINNSVSRYKGTLRGLHYQLEPKAEDKIIRCINGALFDVIIDLRQDSETFKKWFGIKLTAVNRKMLFVPKGFAHGLLTLSDNTEIFYLVNESYSPKYERGIRWNDLKFNIEWPIQPVIISDKDRHFPDFRPDYHLK